MREPDGLGMNVSNLDDGPATYIPLFFQEAMAAPLSTEEFLCDDMGMPELSRQPKRMPRLWFRSSVKRRSDQSSLSGSSGQTKQVYRRVVRRLTRRPSLGKTRSLFVRSSGSFIMSGLITPHDVAEKTSFLDLDRGRSSMAGDDAAKFMAERRNQRCHSEQPHAWRKPSATLWTLQEQEE